MPKTRSPRKGSMQFWPRKRAKRPTARVRYWARPKDPLPAGFIGYKVGMTHLIAKDNKANSHTKGMDLAIPVTIVDCPPIKIFAINFYKKNHNILLLHHQIFQDQPDKHLARVLALPKKKQTPSPSTPEEYAEIRVLIHTQPWLAGFKKTPDVAEIALGGTLAQQHQYAHDHLGKEVSVQELFKENEQLDIHAITKGKGYQGPVKRFGVEVRHHKSEKTKRGPGSLGNWTMRGSMSWTVPHAGQMGYHQRLQLNKQLLKISTTPQDINPKGGFSHYGIVKNSYLLIKGSLQGPAKRAITITHAHRPNKKALEEVTIAHVHT